MRGGAHTVVADDGARLHVLAEGEAGRPAVLLACSLAATLSMWDAQAAMLDAAGFRVLRFDTRGHGGSEAPAGAYTLDRLGRDALAVIEAMGESKVAFCGLSLGGLVGLWLALEAPHRISSLCVANSNSSFAPAAMWIERAETALLKGMDGLADTTVTRWLTPEFRASRPEATEQVRCMIAATSPIGYAGCCAALAEADLTPRLGAIQRPTRIIGGRHDPSTPPESARRLAAAIPGAALTLLDAAHLSNVEAARDFNDALLTHLAATSGVAPHGEIYA